MLDSIQSPIGSNVVGTRDYIDLQVNGYAGVDFNQDDLTSEDLHLACLQLRSDGVAGVLATIITDSVEAMRNRLQRLVSLRNGDELARQIILGFHIEGPFISRADDYHGAHPPNAIRPADAGLMNRLLDSADGLVRIVTLAPEFDASFHVIRMLDDQGIIVSAGHCNPTLDQLDGAIDAGLSMFTHLGNGCPMTMARHDNIIQRALFRSDRLWISFIADGIHVDFHALANYLRLAGDRAIIVTDAMAAAGRGPGRYQFGKWDIEVGMDLAAWSPTRAHLLGSAMTMVQAECNLKTVLGLTPQRIDRMLRTVPLELLGLKDSADKATGRSSAIHEDAGPNGKQFFDDGASALERR
jgi:N-acetylglucosamine-6-phosphate deacetylase